MREFYEEQFALSSSNKPVIRLRKMDPAFSKLQEINFWCIIWKIRIFPIDNLLWNIWYIKNWVKNPTFEEGKLYS